MRRGFQNLEKGVSAWGKNVGPTCVGGWGPEGWRGPEGWERPVPRPPKELRVHGVPRAPVPSMPRETSFLACLMPPAQFPIACTARHVPRAPLLSLTPFLCI